MIFNQIFLGGCKSLCEEIVEIAEKGQDGQPIFMNEISSIGEDIENSTDEFDV